MSNEDFPRDGPFVVSRKDAHTESEPQADGGTDSMRAKNNYLNRWRMASALDNFNSDDEEENTDVNKPGSHRGWAMHPAHESTPLRQSYATHPHFSRRGSYLAPGPHDYGRNPSQSPLYLRLTIWAIVVIICALAFSLVLGLFLASSRPLQDLQIAKLYDAFPSDKELVFSMVVGAENPAYLSVQINYSDLDVFVTSSHVESNSARSILLGTVKELESPLIYEGSFFESKHVWDKTTVRLDTPCNNTAQDGDMACRQWNNISSHDFELTVRGTFKYKLMLIGDMKEPVSASTEVKVLF